MKNLNNTAFSLLEVLLASIIFIISIGGIFATLNAVRTPVSNKENALSAALFGKQVLEALRSQVTQQALANFYACSVNQNPCPDFALSVGQHQISAATLATVGLSWPSTALSTANGNVVTYTAACADGSSPCGADTARRVDLNINW